MKYDKGNKYRKLLQSYRYKSVDKCEDCKFCKYEKETNATICTIRNKCSKKEVNEDE